MVCPLNRLCDLGERGEPRGDNGGVDPSLKAAVCKDNDE